MSHPKIPERPYHNQPPQRGLPHAPQSTPSLFTNDSTPNYTTTNTTTTTTTQSSATTTSRSSAATTNNHPPVKNASGIINFGANFREHLENSLETISNIGSFKKYAKLDSLHLSQDSEISLERRAADLGIKFFFVAYSTLNSDCRTCLVPASSIAEVQKHGCHLATAMFFKTTGADPDMFLVPDPKTLIQLPWKPEYAWVQGNMYCNGQPAPQCPRRTLINLMDRAKNLGLVMKSGIEPEFTILNKDGSDLGDPLDSKQPMSLHDPLSIMRLAPLLTNIHDVMHSLGWGPYQIDHEATKCQYEINFNYADALTTADRHCFMKFMMKQLAEQEGYRVTFMPVPFSDLLCSNGMHINVSLWSNDGRVNLFPIDGGGGDGDGGSIGGGGGGGGGNGELGISKTALNFIGGLLAHVEESCAILCPTVNSYKRLNLGSWCPNTVTWGGNNRTVLLRVPARSRVEHRLADGSTNPYLAQAVILAAGLDGIQREIDPGPLVDFEVHTRPPNEFRAVPGSLLESLNRFEASEFYRECLGDELVEGFVHMKRKEWSLYAAHVCQWEKDYYVNC